MNKNLRKIEIFVSSPGDTAAERKIITQVISELNSLQHVQKNFHLRALTYEMETPGAVGDIPQRIIDRYMTQPKDADIFVCVFWSRMGTPLVDPDTQIQYQSGTHYEFVQAYESNQRQGRPIILLYRCMRPIPPNQNLDQALRVQKFFDEFEGQNATYKGLYKSYHSNEEFAQFVRQDLDKILAQIASTEEAGGEPESNFNAMERSLKGYLQVVAEQSRQVSYHINLSVPLENVDYEKIFVLPRLIYPKAVPPKLLSAGDLAPFAVTPENGFDLDEFLARGERQLLLGELGSGKTTLIKHVCKTLAGQNLASIPGPIPVYVSGMELSLYLDTHSESINSSIESPYLLYCAHVMEVSGHRDLSVRFWQDLFGSHPVLLVIDGLDEISLNSSREYLVDALRQLQQRFPKLKTIIALRPSAYRENMFGGGYQLGVLLPFDDGQRDTLSRNLQDLSGATDQTMDSAWSTVHDMRDARWVGNPLCLTVAFLTSLRAISDLHLARTFINEKIISLMLDDWNIAKFRFARMRVGFLGGVENNVVGPTDMEILEFIAWNLYEQEEETLDLDDLTKWFMMLDDKLPQRQAGQLAETRIRLLCERSELLNVSQYNKVGFRESRDVLFFASSRYGRNAKIWTGLLSFLLDIKKHKEFFSTLFDLIYIKDPRASKDFLVYMLDSADQVLAQQSKAELILYVTECFLKTAGDLNGLKERVIRSVLTVLEDKAQVVSLETRINLGRALGLIGDPRVGGNMVLIPKGEFYMGYDMFPDDRPAQRVLVDDFYIDQYPVTNAQFGVFIQDNGYGQPDYWTDEGWKWVCENGRTCPKYWHDDRFNLPNYPVVGVSWYEASAYAAWAGKRLPTEKEWEKAARGSERNPQNKRLIGRSWAWGDEFRSDFLNCAEGLNPVNGTTPIGVYPAGMSPFGVFDMCGNVSEWTADWFKAYENNNYVDAHFGEKYRVRRGGGWAADQDFVRCTCRIGSLPTSDFAVVGFRCCASMRP